VKELQGQVGEKLNRLAELNSELDWYRVQYESLDALVEALQTDNGWLEYKLMAAEDALIDQRTCAAEYATVVDKVKASLQENEGVLATANDQL
jgi:chromosome segregation ATPase